MAGETEKAADDTRPAGGGTPPAHAQPDVRNTTPAEEEIMFSDNDSGLDWPSLNSSTESVTSSIMRYRVENGRTYHAFKDGSYLLPNDSVENERLDLQHTLCLMSSNDRLYFSPIDDKPLHRVLDAGCGTGIWAMDFADQRPESHITGIDLSPIQPSYVPPNVTFYVDDLEAEWTYSAPFDFIYMRLISGAIVEWPKLLDQAYRHPGAYIELFDVEFPVQTEDDSLPNDCPLKQWFDLLLSCFSPRGNEVPSGELQKRRLAEAGFINVVYKEIKWPMNGWPSERRDKELGELALVNSLQALQAITIAPFTRILGWSPDRVEVFLTSVRKDLQNKKYHVYQPLYVLYAQKPG